MREGIAGVATLVGIQRNVAATTVGAWDEHSLDVELPGIGPYRARWRVALELSTASRIAVRGQVLVRVDPADR